MYVSGTKESDVFRGIEASGTVTPLRSWVFSGLYKSSSVVSGELVFDDEDWLFGFVGRWGVCLRSSSSDGPDFLELLEEELLKWPLVLFFLDNFIDDERLDWSSVVSDELEWLVLGFDEWKLSFWSSSMKKQRVIFFMKNKKNSLLLDDWILDWPRWSYWSIE